LLSFNTGKKFLNYLETLPEGGVPDLILFDYYLSEINGEQILDFLSKDKKHMPVIQLVWSTSDANLYETS
jgi:CheY-like chemotaxis protein